jgi:hypothetical protein
MPRRQARSHHIKSSGIGKAAYGSSASISVLVLFTRTTSEASRSAILSPITLGTNSVAPPWQTITRRPAIKCAWTAADTYSRSIFLSQRGDALIHHSDRGSQYVSIGYSERLAEAGVEPSVGSNGDSYDNALAETINGLYKAELIHRRAPWKTREAVELATLEWVAWFNHHRPREPLGYMPPAEAEANYYKQLSSQATPA